MYREQDAHRMLFRRNNKGLPCYWFGELDTTTNLIVLHHGVVGKTDIIDYITTHRKIEEEYKSMIAAKRKTGYKYLDELRDNIQIPVEGSIEQYLNTYLPYDRTTGAGNMLPMLAKVYDNTNNKLFAKCSLYLGQWKINGLRCSISAIRDNSDLFRPIKLQFQSREGTIWNSLTDLEDYLLAKLPSGLIAQMCDEEFILDGELYLPGHSVNEINHFVKDPKCKENKLIQYWCYDIAIRDAIQNTRHDIRMSYLADFTPFINSKEMHYQNFNRLINLPTYDITNGTQATILRDKAIDCGFEGAILRNPDKEYQYGARNLAMIKYKRSTDGKFEIIEIKSEGIKRPDIPLFTLRNDINNATFEVHVGGSFDYQRSILRDKEKYIGKKMFVEYGERSGVEQVPFHVKQTYIID